MKKREINVLEHATEIMTALQNGVLLTTKAEDKVNSMTISWGSLCIEWGKPAFITFVRESRFTKELLEKNPEFTVNIPVGASDKKVLGLCGTKSGRDIDKIEALNLTLETPNLISVPAIREFPMTLECKVVYKQKQDLSALPKGYLEQFYPENADNSFNGANRDCHIAFYGEIVSAYIIE